MAIVRVIEKLQLQALSTDVLPILFARNVGSVVFLQDTDTYKRWNGTQWLDTSWGL